MQIQDFLRVYQEKSDEELLQLAAAGAELTSEATLALESELSRRGISVAQESETPESDAAQNSIRNAGAGQRLQEGKWQGHRDFVEEVLRTYRTHFWLFFNITAPAVVISTFVFITRSNGIREIAKHLPRGVEVLAYRTELLEIWLINVFAFLISWMAFSFSFGAICIAVEEKTAGFISSAWRCLFNVRERFAPFVGLCLLLFLLVGAAEAGSVLLATAVPVALGQWHIHLSWPYAHVLFYGVAGLAVFVLSRLALSVPAVVLDDCTVWQSLFRSIEITKGKWLVLAALLAKSLIGGYVAGMAPYWLASFVPVGTSLPAWFPWVLTAASIVGVSVVEPTMFVGFALLYLKMTAPDIAPSGVLASQLA
jgi:hypothetical protein